MRRWIWVRKVRGFLVSLGFLGLGSFLQTTTITAGELVYKLTSNSADGALVFGELPSFTLGGGVMTGGEGVATYLGNQYTSKSVSGTNWFFLAGFEYEVPLPILPTIEAIVGYRENRLTFKDFSSGSNTLNNIVKIKTVQYLFGFGMVF